MKCKDGMLCLLWFAYAFRDFSGAIPIRCKKQTAINLSIYHASIKTSENNFRVYIIHKWTTMTTYATIQILTFARKLSSICISKAFNKKYENLKDGTVFLIHCILFHFCHRMKEGKIHTTFSGQVSMRTEWSQVSCSDVWPRPELVKILRELFFTLYDINFIKLIWLLLMSDQDL